MLSYYYRRIRPFLAAYFLTGLLTTAFIILCWFLMAKKRMSPIKVMLLLVAVAFVGVLLWVVFQWI